MGKSDDVEIRPNYNADASYLLRLAKAIEREDDEPSSWRREVVVKISELVVLLSEGSKRKIMRDMEKWK